VRGLGIDRQGGNKYEIEITKIIQLIILHPLGRGI
jgi:hypothetical protein